MKLKFEKQVIGQLANPDKGGPMNVLGIVGDISGNGIPDVVVSGRNGEMAWFENPGKQGEFKKHHIDNITNLECGGSVYDLTGNGYGDVINGSDAGFNEIYWWENPGAEGGEWKKHLIGQTGKRQFHNTIIGDVTGDGKQTLFFSNQKGGADIYMVSIPDDVFQEPWPGVELIASEMREKNPYKPEGYQPEEGLAIGDVDGDGINELVAGTHWMKLVDGKWVTHKFAEGYITTVIAIGDVDGDGKNEIVLSEGDPLVYGQMEGGKVGWFKPGDDITALWEEHRIAEGLFDAHTCRVADFTGNGMLDILVGEVGEVNRQVSVEGVYITRPPLLIIYQNLGNGVFSPFTVAADVGIHEASVADMDGDGKPDIIGKPLWGPEKWNIHVYFNRSEE